MPCRTAFGNAAVSASRLCEEPAQHDGEAAARVRARISAAVASARSCFSAYASRG